MTGNMIGKVLKALGTNPLLERLARLKRKLHALKGIEVLPGTPYSRYAIPVDYLPSREYAPRYGYSHGKIEALEQWFAAHNDEYLKFLDYMRTLNVGHIPISQQEGEPLMAAWRGGAICAFDLLALYAMVCKHRPKTYAEIGSGMSTCFVRQAIKDAGLDTRIISIDPNPRGEVDAICDEVKREGLETCDLSTFDQLGVGDILFVDGSHRAFMNSDVTVFFIDVLPRIKPGVLIHIHDVDLPWDYHDYFKHWYWNEQYMLAVYLMTGREHLDPILPTTWICRGMSLGDDKSLVFVDLGSAEANSSWKGGGSMWFTKRTD